MYPEVALRRVECTPWEASRFATGLKDAFFYQPLTTLEATIEIDLESDDGRSPFRCALAYARHPSGRAIMDTP